MKRAAAACACLLAVACSRAKVSPPGDLAAATVAPPPCSVPATFSVDAVAGKAFGALCLDDRECAGGVCFHKRIKGDGSGAERRGASEAVEHDGYCSMRCAADLDCPVPPTKGRCGARGMCKRPD